MFKLNNTALTSSHYLSTNAAAQNIDYYDVLHIRKNAGRKEIKLAYYKLSKQFHPDINLEKGAEDKFKKIQEAYHILGDDRKKLEYDRQINEGYYKEYGSNSGTGSYSSSSSASDFKPGDFKKRTGSVYTGKTNIYDFDEYYREHYVKNRRTYTYQPHGSTFSSTNSDEELKNYWNRKEFSSAKESNFIDAKSFFIKLAVFNGILISFYFFINALKQKEKELVSQRKFMQRTNENR
jgi:DnaJ-class molecular chaperone